MTDTTDVLIAGGGLVGSALALAVAQAGLRVTLCDARPLADAPGDFDGRAYAIAAACGRMLDLLGVWGTLAPDAAPMTDILVTDGRGRAAPGPGILHFDHRAGEGGPFAHMVEHRHIRAALTRALGPAGVDVRTPGAVADHVVGPGQVTVTLSDGAQVRARVLVACDGRHSAIAARAGIRQVGWDYPQTGLVAAVTLGVPHGGVAHEYFLPGGPFAILPLTGDRASLVWTERSARAAALAALPDAQFRDALQALFGPFLGTVTLAGGRHATPLSLWLAQSWVRPRIALAGEAAHGIHPLAGQGLNLGLKDAAALAEVLVEAQRRGEDIGALDVLTRYQTWRRFDTMAVALACDGLNRLFSNDIGALRVLRGAGLALVDRLPTAKRGFMRIAAGDSGTPPRLLRGLPL